MPHALGPPLLQDKQATCWQESQVWHMVVVSAAEAESFSLCPVPDARCVTMSGGILAVQA